MLIPNIQAVRVDPVELGILNSTLVLMMRTGFKQITMQHIIQSSDLSKSQIYRHFASKEDLVCRLLLANEMDLSERLDSWLTADNSSDLLERYLQFLMKRPEKHQLIQSLEYWVENDLADNEQAIQWQRLKSGNLSRLENGLTQDNAVVSLSSIDFKMMLSLLRGLAQTNQYDYFENITTSVKDVKQSILKLINT